VEWFNPRHEPHVLQSPIMMKVRDSYTFFFGQHVGKPMSLSALELRAAQIAWRGRPLTCCRCRSRSPGPTFNTVGEATGASAARDLKFQAWQPTIAGARSAASTLSRRERYQDRRPPEHQQFLPRPPPTQTTDRSSEQATCLPPIRQDEARQVSNIPPPPHSATTTRAR
jgi:hypothetical protein